MPVEDPEDSAGRFQNHSSLALNQNLPFLEGHPGRSPWMKQKYAILKDLQEDTLIIREYAELDKEILSLLCEETYEGAVIQRALEAGRSELMAALRTKNMYPPNLFAEKIAVAVEELFRSDEPDNIELAFDDTDLLHYEDAKEKEVQTLEDDGEDVDDIIDDEMSGTYDGDDEIKQPKQPLKIADDDAGDVDNTG